MRKILFDLYGAQPVGDIKFHGGGEYIKSIFAKLVSLGHEYVEIDVLIDKARFIDNWITDIINEHHIKVININDCKKVHEKVDLCEYDVFYTGMPYLYTDIELPSSTCYIYTLHGLRNLETLEAEDHYMDRYLTLRQRIRRYIKAANPEHVIKKRKSAIQRLFNCTNNRYIITDSDFSKYSICKFFPKINSDDVHVFYAPAKQQTIGNEKNVLSKYRIETQKYILLVSADRWEKNCYRAVEALNGLYNSHSERLKDIKVVMCGVVNKRIYNKAINNKDKFIMLGYVDSEELEVLYKNAHMFLYPTLNEGFGYPPIEAMKYGTLTAASAICSVPEVCGDAVMYFNPYSINEMQNKILQSFDKNIQLEYNKRMKKQYEKITRRQEEDLCNIVNLIIDHR